MEKPAQSNADSNSPAPDELCELSEQTLQAMREAMIISRDPNVKGYDNMEDLRKALNE